MYRRRTQYSIEDFVFPYGELSPNNRWVVMAGMIDWDAIEDRYAEGFAEGGAPAHPARMAFGSLAIKQYLGVSDEELVCQVAENPYMQFLIGLKGFREGCPFGASTLVAFRKRFPESDLVPINEQIIAGGRADDDGPDDDADNDGGDGNKGTLILDATVAPSDIAYPTDVGLLDKARARPGSMIDCLCAQSGAGRPRTYREVARRDFCSWSRRRRKTKKATRSAVRRQLGYASARPRAHRRAGHGRCRAYLSDRQGAFWPSRRSTPSRHTCMRTRRTRCQAG